ncbi:MAG: ZIP family metal transporter [Bacilli bacterium]
MSNSVIYSFIITFIAGASTCIGSLFIFIKINRVEEFISFSLGLSLSIMISISIFELLPTSILYIVNNNNIFIGIIYIIISFLLGYITINLINKKINKCSTHNNLYSLGILSLTAIILHNIPEGIATFMSSYTNISTGILLAFGILLHNIPEGISIAIPLFYYGKKRGVIVLYTLIAGLSESLGALITYVFLKDIINYNIISIILIYVSGLMMCLSINQIYPEAISYNKKKSLILGIVLGILLFFISSILLKILIT